VAKTTIKPPLWVIKLNNLDYETTWKLQNMLQHARLQGRIDNVLLILQHPPVITLGRKAKEEDILAEIEELEKRGIKVFITDRGGKVTYHGPGQLIGYPILSLSDYNLSVGEYIRQLEEVILFTLKDLDIEAKRIPGQIGVWVGKKKIASLGIKVRGGVTSHGFALNVNNDLTPFLLINPCGIKGLEVTSIRILLKKEIELKEVEELIIKNFCQVFPAEPKRTLNFGL